MCFPSGASNKSAEQFSNCSKNGEAVHGRFLESFKRFRYGVLWPKSKSRRPAATTITSASAGNEASGDVEGMTDPRGRLDLLEGVPAAPVRLDPQVRQARRVRPARWVSLRIPEPLGRRVRRDRPELERRVRRAPQARSERRDRPGRPDRRDRPARVVSLDRRDRPARQVPPARRGELRLANLS